MKMVVIKMNVSSTDLPVILENLPAMRSPTITPLTEGGWSSVEIAVNKDIARDLIPRLKRQGAMDIIEHPLTRVF